MCQSFRSLALTVWEFWCFEYLEEKDDLLNESINDGGVCRTAPATTTHCVCLNVTDVVLIRFNS